MISSSPAQNGLLQGVDESLHQVLSQARLLGPVGLDQRIVPPAEDDDRAAGPATPASRIVRMSGIGMVSTGGSGRNSMPKGAYVSEAN